MYISVSERKLFICYRKVSVIIDTYLGDAESHKQYNVGANLHVRVQLNLF